MNCIICGGRTHHHFTKEHTQPPASDFMRSIGPAEYCRCSRCGFVLSRTHAGLSRAQWNELNAAVHHFYESEPGRGHGNQPPYAEQAMMLVLLRANGLIAPHGMLDYAAGYGTLSAILHRYFQIELPVWDAYVRSGDPARYIDQPIPGAYQTVINSAMFEHVLNRDDLDSVNALVAPDGCLVIHTVVCENVPADPDWFYVQSPVHTAFHTNSSMSILMKQWGYRSSLYCPQSKSWTLFRSPFAEIEAAMTRINRELQTKWLHGKIGFMDYWKGF